jgi:hypothetical protein
MPFNLAIGTPSHGWAETTIHLGDAEVFIDLSDVGPDSFRQLASAAIFAITAHSGSERVEFFEEPAGKVMEVTALGAGQVQVTISGTELLYGPPARGLDPIASCQMPARELALGIWRSLRAHEQMLREAHAQENWLAYPEAEMAVLTAKLTGAVE